MAGARSQEVGGLKTLLKSAEHAVKRMRYEGQHQMKSEMESIHPHIELPRRALRQSAKLHGTSALHYFDLEAPQIAPPDENELT